VQKYFFFSQDVSYLVQLYPGIDIKKKLVELPHGAHTCMFFLLFGAHTERTFGRRIRIQKIHSDATC